MPHQTSKAHKVSLYRLTPVADQPLRSYVQQKYLDAGFVADEVVVSEVAGLLASGTIGSGEVRWLQHISALTGQQVDVQNRTAAVMLLPFEGYLYALAWGFGHLLIRPDRIDPGFGLRFAIRRANAQQVRSLTIHTMDTLARTARTSVPTGAAVTAFGMEEIGESVSRLVGRIPATGLSGSRGGDEDYLTIRGADGLSMPMGRMPADLLADLRVLHDIVEHEPPVEGLELFEYTRPLRPGDRRLTTLVNERLAPALQPRAPKIALCWPAEWDEEYGEASSFRLKGLGRGDWERQPDMLELDHLLSPLADRPVESRVAALKRITIQGLDADESPISRAISADKWLTFETDLDGHQYVFHQGRWFDIGGAYLDLLHDRVKHILAQRSNLVLPGWRKEHKRNGTVGPVSEGRYNVHVPDEDSGFVCLDHRLLYTDQHPAGIEACDLLGPNDELIHVKRLDDSVSASHLFNQAVVSAEALRRQPDARVRLQERVAEFSSGMRHIPDDFRPRKVVLAFAGRPATSYALFTFSQVTLVRCALRLADLEAELEVLEIPDCDKMMDK